MRNSRPNIARTPLVIGLIAGCSTVSILLAWAAIHAEDHPAAPILRRSPASFDITIEDRAYGQTIGVATPITVTGVTVADAIAVWDSAHASQTWIADRITPALETLLSDGMNITIQRSAEVHFIRNGANFTGRATGNAVGEALAENGLLPNGLDYVMPGENTMLDLSLPIRVVRVAEHVETHMVLLPFETRLQVDTELAPRVRRVVQSGMTGVALEHTVIHYEDNTEISRGVSYRVIVIPPRDLVIAVGSP